MCKTFLLEHGIILFFGLTETHISPKDVFRFLKSKACQEAAEFLAREDPVVTRQGYSLARNYLHVIAKTLLYNGQRSGAVSSLTIDHVKQETMDDGFHVALVCTHTQTHTHILVKPRFSLHKVFHLIVTTLCSSSASKITKSYLKSLRLLYVKKKFERRKS